MIPPYGQQEPSSEDLSSKKSSKDGPNGDKPIVSSNGRINVLPNTVLSSEISCTNSVSVFHINIQCLSKKLEQIALFLDDFKFNVVCVSEQWQNETNLKTINIPGFMLVNYFCRKYLKMGGVAIYLRQGLIYKPLELNTYNVDFHSEFCGIELQELKTLVLTLYRSLSGDFRLVLENLECLLENFMKVGQNVVILDPTSAAFLSLPHVVAPHRRVAIAIGDNIYTSVATPRSFRKSSQRVISLKPQVTAISERIKIVVPCLDNFHLFRDCCPFLRKLWRNLFCVVPSGLISEYFDKMKTEDKNNMPKVRIAVIGKSNVGKSALTVRYLTRRFIGEYRSNTDLMYRQTLTVNNSALEVEIVDVCSCDVQAFPEEAIYWADACVVVYDITCRNSFTQATDMLQRVLQLRNQIPTVLLGNKADLEHLRQIEKLEGRTVAVQNNCQFYEVSVAENSPTIYSAFDAILNECRSVQSTQKTRKFSVSKMIGTLIGNANSKGIPNTNQGGTVVVCHKSDLYKSRVLRRRQNFTATASL
ncbi:hypothetical protein JTB14_001137 [Gonioctena quinquepunctata]|nr:hypothetical protein JTB14_001137 [Gonioctena quinquepunctata]